jgi:tRNA threonylcarbamoyladenosine biosynthesis protein TsaB
VEPGDLDAVACGGGPGSFTSLRIAAAIAKGIARARRLPLITTPSPVLIVAGAVPPLAAGTWMALLDAMRGDVFGMEVTVHEDGRLSGAGAGWRSTREEAERRASAIGAGIVGPGESPALGPRARGFAAVIGTPLASAADVSTWEPEYGRKAEAQVRWEAVHGRSLDGA